MPSSYKATFLIHEFYIQICYICILNHIQCIKNLKFTPPISKCKHYFCTNDKENSKVNPNFATRKQKFRLSYIAKCTETNYPLTFLWIDNYIYTE